MSKKQSLQPTGSRWHDAEDVFVLSYPERFSISEYKEWLIGHGEGMVIEDMPDGSIEVTVPGSRYVYLVASAVDLDRHGRMVRTRESA